MKIGYIGGFWAANIGNSFYNLGALYLLEKVYGKDNIYFLPDPPQIAWSGVENDYKLLNYIDVDLFIISGPIFSKQLLSVYTSLFDNIKKRGKKIAFISIGSVKYTKEEAVIVSDFLNNYDIEYVMTRDYETYKLYKNKLETKIFNGLCASMFLNDAINVPNINDKYIVSNFSFFKEPHIEKKNNNWKIQHSFFPSFQNNIDGFKIVRTNNSFFIPMLPKIHKGWLLFNRNSMYYSDLPFGYLAILKSAEIVFSDRVHSCAATLILGGKAMYVKGSKRSHDGRNNLFKRIKLDNIYIEPVQLDFKYIINEKDKMYKFLMDSR